MMTRKYSNALEEPEYARNHRSLPLELSRSVRETARVFPIGSHTAAVNINRDSEAHNEKQRRRIAVACSRCRKRKIKCSGDIGNGQGCQNCRNAGTDPQNCQFLRVNSSSFDCPSADWPYLLSGTGPITPNNSSMALLNSNSNNAGQALSSSSFPGANRLSRYPLVGQYPYQHMQNSQDYYGYGIMGANENVFDSPYGISMSQQNYLSSQEPPSLNVFGGTENVKHWHSAGSSGRHAPASFDTDISSTRYISSGNSYTGVLTALPRTEAGPLFPGMGSLAHSLPASSLLENRLLPSPRSVSLSSGTEAQSATSQLLNGENQLNSQESKAIVPWGSERIATRESQVVPVTVSTSTSGSLVSAGSGKSSSSSPQEIHESAFGYISVPTAQNSPVVKSSPTSEICSSIAGSTSASLNDQFLYRPHHPTESRESLRSHLVSSSSYSYTTRNAGKHGQSTPGPESTLLSGQTYQPFNHLRPFASHQSSSMISETLRRDTGDISACETPRSSVATLSKLR